MAIYYARRVKFQNGERISVLQQVEGLPVHTATLFLDGMRSRNLASATLHYACMALAVFHQEMDEAGIDVMHRLKQGLFLSRHELTRLVAAARHPKSELGEEPNCSPQKVVSIHSVYPRKKKHVEEDISVGLKTAAGRLRYISLYLEWCSSYVMPSLPREMQRELHRNTEVGLRSLRALIPRVSSRNTLGRRTGLSYEEQGRLERLVDPHSPENPWENEYVRYRNQVIVLTLLASGMRQGELLGLRISDIHPQTGKIKILRRPDKEDDPRLREPNTKTLEREIAFDPSIIKLLNQYINVHRKGIKNAHKKPQVFISTHGHPLSGSSVEKLFQTLREALPNLSVILTSHVLRHTWNLRFSEYADEMGTSSVEEERARAEQQGWSSYKTAEVYTRRHIERKGQELALGAQKKLHTKVRGDINAKPNN
ncbi:tyrosine-type recombinase/integrase [Comamonas jiangduensis]|uniref:tyrosine-type recombinase/integrase n=1 Tax=Comamonas jiangduensis TaxID=1194168 RepID=UPI003BF78C9A